MYLSIGLLKLKTLSFTYLFLKVIELNLEFDIQRTVHRDVFL